MAHRYQLDGSQRERKFKIDCPYCGGRKTFTRYKDYETGEYLDNYTGSCDRADKCQAHVKPKDFFVQHPDKKPVGPAALLDMEEKPLVNIPPPFLLHTLNDYSRNSFVNALLNHFPADQVQKAVEDYFIGTVEGGFKEETNSNISTVFWFVNAASKIRAGQVKLFNGECKTQPLQIGDNTLKAYWIHRIIKRGFKKAGKPLPEWYEDYNAGPKVTSLYGEHLLPRNPGKAVALCEAPKSAIIGSIVYPQFVWLATTSLSYLTKDRCRILAGRKVHLFPDTGIPNPKTGKRCLDQWQDRVSEFSELASFTIETVLEDHTTDEEKAAGFDIADYLLSRKRAAGIELNTSDIAALTCETQTGKDFDRLRMVTAQLKDGKTLYDILFNAEGEPVTNHPKIAPLSSFFNKQFQPARLDGKPCLISIV